MADPTVKVRISATDDASRTIEATQSSFARFGKFLASSFVVTLGDITRAIGDVIGAFSRWIAASAEQERATASLAGALARFPVSIRDVTTALVEQASQLELTTRFSNDSVIAAQALLATLGVAPEKLNVATQATVDLAAALGISLEAAARNVGKTVGGFAGELGEVIPALKDLGDEALKSGEGIELLADLFQGRAAADAETFSGKIATIGNLMGDLGKAIGQAITQNEALSAFLTRIQEGAAGAERQMAPLIVALNGLVTFAVKAAGALLDLSQRFVSFNLTIASGIDAVRRFVGVESDLEARIRASIAAAEAQVQAWKDNLTSIDGVIGASQELANRQRDTAAATNEATQATADQSTIAEDLVGNLRDLANGNRALIPSLDSVRNSARQAAGALASYNAQAAASGLVARSPSAQEDVNRAVAAGIQPILGGTRIRLVGGGSRLLGNGAFSRSF